MEPPLSDDSFFKEEPTNPAQGRFRSDDLTRPQIDRIETILAEELKAYMQSLCNAAPDLNSMVERYVAGLFQKIGDRIRLQDLSREGNFETAVRDAIVEGGEELYFTAGRDVLGPLVTRFVEHILTDAPRGATIAFLARDAELYFEAAKILAERPDILDRDLKLRYVTLNRQHFKIQDENLNREQPTESDHEQERLRELYMKQQMFDNPNGVVIVDTGCWGTMIEKLWNAMAEKGRDVLNLTHVYFMYSYNPAIYGYVNHIAQKNEQRYLASQGVFIGDTFECLPKPEESSTGFSMGDDGVVEPVRRPITSHYLSSWNEAVLRGIRASSRRLVASPSNFPTAEEALKLIEQNRVAAGEEFTGVLPQATPKWTKGDEYLRNWKLAPISPQQQPDAK